VSELDTADDPRELVPGDPARIWRMADHYERMGVRLAGIGLALRSVDDGGWRGEAADAFRADHERRPGRFLFAADAFGTAAGALDAYAHALSWAQRQAGEAIALAANGEPDETTAPPEQLTPAQQAELTGVLTAPPALEPDETHRPLRVSATELLDHTRDQLAAIGKEAAQKVRAVANLAPTRTPQPPPPFRPQRTVPPLRPIVLRPRTEPDAAALHPDARIKSRLDHDVLRDGPAAWVAGAPALRELLRPPGWDQLTPDLQLHLFDGHRNPTGSRHPYSGYHHRPGGLDLSPLGLRVTEILTGPNASGVYEALFTGPLAAGCAQNKKSSFFPDSWSRDEVKRAILAAFHTRTHTDKREPRQWEGSYRGVRIKGYVAPKHPAPHAARIYDVVTAYPIVR
jgi:hypothetical protein